MDFKCSQILDQNDQFWPKKFPEGHEIHKALIQDL